MATDRETIRDESIHKASCSGCPACKSDQPTTSMNRTLTELEQLVGFVPPKKYVFTAEDYLNRDSGQARMTKKDASLDPSQGSE